MSNDEVSDHYRRVLASGINKPGTLAATLKADHLRARKVLADVLEVIESPDSEWWMKDPYRGGFDAEAIREALTDEGAGYLHLPDYLSTT